MSSKIYVETVGESASKVKKLNLNSNLSDIRKELEKKNDMSLLLFAEKLNNNEFAEIDCDDENDMLLSDIVFDNSGNNFLYLQKNSSPCWNHLNKKCKLAHGRTMSFDGIEIAEKKAFTINDCEFHLVGAEGYKKGQLEFKSEEDWMKKTNLFFDINVQNFIGLGLLIGSSNDKNFKDEINSTYKYIEIGKASLKFSSENLKLTEEFKSDIEKP